MDLRSPIRVIAPRLEGDVLRVLVAADSEFTGRQVHGLVGHGSPEGIRQALKRLVDEGVVDQRGAGRALLYRFNREHIAAPCIEGLTRLREQLIRRMRDEIATWEVQPVVAALFGSAARGDAGPKSDLDLFFVRPDDADEDRWERQIADFAERTTRWTGNDARPLEFGEEELGGASSREPVISDILEHGVVLAGSLRRLRALSRG